MPERHDPELWLGQASPALAREQAREWAASSQMHLSEAQIEALRAAVPTQAELEHLLDCEDCAMRARSQLAAPAASVRRRRPRAQRPRLRNALLAAAAGLVLFLAGQWRAGRDPIASATVATSLSLYDPAALQRSDAGEQELRLSELHEGRLAILVNCDCPGELATWELRAPEGRTLQGQHAFAAGARVFKEFVIDVDVATLLQRRGGELRLSVAGPEGPCADWLFRVRS